MLYRMLGDVNHRIGGGGRGGGYSHSFTAAVAGVGGGFAGHCTGDTILYYYYCYYCCCRMHVQLHAVDIKLITSSIRIDYYNINIII